jgi:hypothetical protein
MKKFFFIPVLIILTFILPSAAQTNVSGFISQNTTWDLAGSPYIVVGNALLSQGYTLIIDPGVIVKFDPDKALQIDGQLIAVGTPSSRIIFTSNQFQPAPGDWAKLHIADFSTDAVFDVSGNYISGTILRYCNFEYAGSLGAGAVHIESASPYMSHCRVEFSSSAGIYCVGSSFLLDSSVVSDNADYGLYFDQYFQHSNSLLVRSDTIQNNANGGLYIGDGGTSFTNKTEIRNNFFFNNSTHGAIDNFWSKVNITIADNFFEFNSAVNRGIIHFYATYTAFHDISITGNYFINNDGSGMITFIDQAWNVNILKNIFSSNTSQAGILNFYSQFTKDTISCNSFLSNQMEYPVIFIRSDIPQSAAIITHNVFESNNNSVQGIQNASVLSIGQTVFPLDFSNNIVRNNFSNGKCIYINSEMGVNDTTELVRIFHNDFDGNASDTLLCLDANLTNFSNINYYYLKFNNFLSPAGAFVLYNRVPYGSPNILADSNYWGTTNLPHVDSVIYDFFDFANQSVVYYLPVLAFPTEVDTVCPDLITKIGETDLITPNLTIFPNPFSRRTTLHFAKEIKNAKLQLCNTVGEYILFENKITGSSFEIKGELLKPGIYFFRIEDENGWSDSGKLIKN